MSTILFEAIGRIKRERRELSVLLDKIDGLLREQVHEEMPRSIAEAPLHERVAWLIGAWRAARADLARWQAVRPHETPREPHAA